MRNFTAAGVISVALVAAGALWVRQVVLPRRPAEAETPRPRPIPSGEERPSPQGAGVRIVVNPNSGSPLVPAPTEALRAGLPEADIHELKEDDDLRELLRDERFAVIGAAGGDGTLAAAAAVASERDALLVAVPSGTLNHLGRDLGIADVADAIAAVQAGLAAPIDLGAIDGRVFVNTLSFGGYSAVVDTRERFEGRIGKWPALFVALMREVPRMRPLHLEVDGVYRRVWLCWIGNGAYSPPGLGPAWREKLDDGLLDVRIVHDGPRFSRTRFVVAALAGRLSACHVYTERRAESVEIVSRDGPLRLAADGETFDGPSRFVVSKRRRAVRVALPPRENARD